MSLAIVLERVWSMTRPTKEEIRRDLAYFNLGHVQDYIDALTAERDEWKKLANKTVHDIRDSFVKPLKQERDTLREQVSKLTAERGEWLATAKAAQTQLHNVTLLNERLAKERDALLIKLHTSTEPKGRDY